MNEKKLLSLKNVLLTLTFLLTTPILILMNEKEVYASEKVEVNGVTYTCYSTNDWKEDGWYDSFEEWYEEDFAEADTDGTILSHFKTYGGICYATYIGTSQNKVIQTLTIENTINSYPVVKLSTKTETDDEYENYNETIISLTLPANIIYFDADEWRTLKALTISSDNPYYSVTAGILYNKKQTEVISYLNATIFNMPATVTTLPNSFSTKLKAINVDKANKKYSSKDGVLYNKKKTELIYYPNRKTTKKYTMPSSVKTIAENALTDHPYLQTLVMSKKITKIYSVCNNMKKLKSVTLPKKVKYIESAFNNCHNLKKVPTIPSSCKYMSSAFESTKKKKSITIQSKKITLTIQNQYASKLNTFSVKKGTVITLQIPWGSKIKSKNTRIASVSTVKNDEKLVKIKATAKGTTTIFDSEDSSYKLILKVQ